MTRRRWIADEVSGNRAALVGAHARHLAQVFRGRVGQELDLAAGDLVCRGRSTRTAGDRVEFVLGEAVCGPSTLYLTPVLARLTLVRMTRVS